MPESPTWFDAQCEFMELDCSTIPEPIVVVSGIVQHHTLAQKTNVNGLHYRNERYVFINPAIPMMQMIYTRFHETVHYLDDINHPGIPSCETEERARKLTALYFNLEYQEEWRDRYGCENSKGQAGEAGGASP